MTTDNNGKPLQKVYTLQVTVCYVRQLKILIGKHNLVSQQSALSKAITSPTIHLSPSYGRYDHKSCKQIQLHCSTATAINDN